MTNIRFEGVGKSGVSTLWLSILEGSTDEIAKLFLHLGYDVHPKLPKDPKALYIKDGSGYLIIYLAEVPKPKFRSSFGVAISIPTNDPQLVSKEIAGWAQEHGHFVDISVENEDHIVYLPFLLGCAIRLTPKYI